MQTRRQQIAGRLTRLFRKSLLLSCFLFVTSFARADVLADGCNSIIAGNLDEAIAALRKATLVLNESPTNDLDHEFTVISAAGPAKALEFLVQDSKAGRFPVQDCKMSAEAVLAFQQGQLQLGASKLESLGRKHSSNAAIVFLANRSTLRITGGKGAAGSRRFSWYGVVFNPKFADAEDKRLYELFSGIQESDRRCLAAFFLMDNGFCDLSRAPSLSDDKPERRTESSPRTGAYSDAYNNFRAAVEFAPTTRVKAACHLGALISGKEVLRRIPRRGVLHFFGGKLIEGEEFRDMLAEHRGSLSAMGIKIPGGLSLPFSTSGRLIILGIIAFLGYAFWPRHRRSQ